MESPAQNAINSDDIERLVSLLQASGVSELTLRSGQSRITVRKPRTREPSGAMIVYDPPEESDYSLDNLPGVEDASPPPRREVRIVAPLVGFYQHVKPLVGLGARVKEGQVVGCIKAVNLINDLPSPVSGVVTDLLVDDGLPVEYGQVLFLIEPDV